MKPIHTILHPTDFSGPSALAMTVAGALARERNARLVILHVVPKESCHTGPGDVSAIRRAECAAKDLKTYRDEMGEKLRHLRPSGTMTVEHQIKSGDVTAEIVRAAEETASELIVLGSHGKSAEARRMLGSVAETVMRQAACPVVVVRAAASRSPDAQPFVAAQAASR